jgi:hypothetical protein
MKCTRVTPGHLVIAVDDGQRRRAVRVIYSGPAPTSGFLDVPVLFGYGSNLLRIVMGDNTGAENGVVYTINVHRMSPAHIHFGCFVRRMRPFCVFCAFGSP